MTKEVKQIYDFVNSCVTNAHELPDDCFGKDYLLGQDSVCAIISAYIEDNFD